MAGLPSLRALHYFHQAAACNSFSLAAQKLNVTHSAISHQIRQLEAWMGKPLFLRINGGVRLTAQGETLLLSCHSAFGELTRICEHIRSDDVRRLRLSCAPSFLSQWLIPRLASFYSRYPTTELQFLPLGDTDQLRNGDVDVLILSATAGHAQDIDVTLIEDDYIGPLCSPQLATIVAGHSDFFTLPLLHADTKRYAWAEWAAKSGVPGNFDAGRRFDNLTLGIQAARNGLGIIMAPRSLVTQELKNGTLVAPLGFELADRATWMMTIRRRQQEEEITQFRDWLQQAVRE